MAFLLIIKKKKICLNCKKMVFNYNRKKITEPVLRERTQVRILPFAILFFRFLKFNKDYNKTNVGTYDRTLTALRTLFNI